MQQKPKAFSTLPERSASCCQQRRPSEGHTHHSKAFVCASQEENLIPFTSTQAPNNSQRNSNQVFEGNAFNAESVTSARRPMNAVFRRGSALWDAVPEIARFLATQLASEASASKLLRLPEITVFTITDGKLEREICQKLLLSEISFQCRTCGPEDDELMMMMMMTAGLEGYACNTALHVCD